MTDFGPKYYPLKIWKGNSFERLFAVKNADKTPFALAGSVWIFRVIWLGGDLRKTTDDGGMTMDLAAGTVFLRLTPQETRLIPAGDKVAKYELERWIGDDQKTYIFGDISAAEWANDD